VSNYKPISPEIEKIVIRWIERFNDNYRTRSTTELKGLARQWSERLSRFGSGHVETAFSLAYDECERFPSFAQIRKRIPMRTTAGGGYQIECPQCKSMNPFFSTFESNFCNRQCHDDFEPERLAGLEVYRQFKRDRPDLFTFTKAIEKGKKLPTRPPVNP